MNNLMKSSQSIGKILLNNHNKINKCLTWSSIRGYQGSDSGAYGGDGKTTVNVLQNSENINLIAGYSPQGFRLTNDLFIRGSVILFPTHVFSWNIRQGADITLESLRVFDLIYPKIKIVVIGYGEQGEPHDASIPIHLKNKGISCELLPTKHAVTTYNYLAADAVHVAGAFATIRGELYTGNPGFTEVEISQEDLDYPIVDEDPTRQTSEEADSLRELVKRQRPKRKV